jgi:hypothetical protein
VFFFLFLKSCLYFKIIKHSRLQMKLFIFSLFHFAWFIIGNDQCTMFLNNSSSFFLRVNIECLEKSNGPLILDLGHLKVYDKPNENLFPNQMLAYKITIKNKVFERILCTIETRFTQSLVSLTLAYNKIEAIDRDSFMFTEFLSGSARLKR